MDEPRIEPGVKIGRFLLDDILRATDLQWNLVNTAVRHQLTEPLLAEIMACLHHVGGVLQQCHGFWVNYDQFGRSSELPGLCQGSGHVTRHQIRMFMKRHGDGRTFQMLRLFSEIGRASS